MNKHVQYQSTISKSNSKIIERVFNLRKELENIENKIPTVIQQQFNFKGRKSPIIGSKIINSLTDSNAKVLDPFLGSGSYIISACENDRKFYGVELDNYTYDIVKTYYSITNLDNLEKIFNNIKNKYYDEIRDLYKTKCCNTTNYIKKLHFDPIDKNYYSPQSHRDIKNRKNIKLLYTCPICGNKDKQFDDFDISKLKEIEKMNVSDFPSHTLIENSRINITKKTGADKYDRNFTKRSKIALLKIQKAISSLPASHEKNLLQHFLVASLTLSRIAQYGSGSEYIYQVMNYKAQEMNVWVLFETKFNNYKNFYNKYISKCSSWYKNKLKLSNSDYKEFISNNFTENSVDLILSDPPYYDQVPYLERNQLYRDWLYYFVDKKQFSLNDDMLDKEIIVSNSPLRKMKKNYLNHVKDIDTIFYHFSKCIKEEGFVVLAVNLGKKKYFDLLSEYILKARKNGFEYISRIDKDLNNPTLRKQAAFNNTFSKEMYLIFNKLPKKDEYWFENDINMEYEIKKYIYQTIIKSEEIFNINQLIIQIEHNILKNSSTYDTTKRFFIKKIIKDSFFVDFKQQVFLNEDKLYVEFEDSESLFVKLYDIIPMIIKNLLLKQEGLFTLSDLYFEISDKLCNGEPRLLQEIINSESKEKEIENLIKNFCTETEKGFIKKRESTKKLKDSVDLRTIDPYGLEFLIKDLLIKEGYKDVAQMGGAGDRGVDLIATKYNKKSQKKEKFIFQVKRWIGNVGSEPIQILNSVKMTDGFDKGICITTSDYTKGGLHEGKVTGIKLLKGKDLIELLNKHYPNKYYIRELKSN